MSIVAGQPATAQDVLDALSAITSTTSIKATGGTSGRTLPEHLSDSLSIKDFGAVCDGVANPVSSKFSTLAAAQAVYPSCLALTDEIDGLALQTLLNTSGIRQIALPAGTVRCSRPMVTDSSTTAIVRGAGRNETIILIVSSNLDGWQHGVSTAATSSLQLRDLTIQSNTSGGSGINIVSNSVPSMDLRDVKITNFSTAIKGKNITASTIYRCTLQGTLSDPLTTNGVVFTSSKGCFQNFWTDCQIVGYNYAFKYVLTGSSTYEGQYWTRCQINNCMSSLLVDASGVTAYSNGVPDYKWINCELENTKNFIDVAQLEGAVFDNCWMLSVGANSGHDCIKLTGCFNTRVTNNRMDLFNFPTNGIDIVGGTNVVVRGNNIGVGGSGAMTTGVSFDSDCTNCTEDQNEFISGVTTSVVDSGTANRTSLARVYTAGSSVSQSFSFENPHGQQFVIGDSGAAIANALTVKGAASGSAPAMTAFGADTNVGMNLVAQGTGTFSFKNTHGNQFQVSDSGAATANIIVAHGASAGSSPGFTAVGNDTSVNIGYTAQAAGGHIFSNTTNGTMFVAQDAGVTTANYLSLKAAATTTGPTITALGSDTNVSINVTGKGVGGVAIGKGSAIATTATGPFLLIPFVAGAPTGTPTGSATGVAICYDTTNNKLWAYNGSAWKGVALT